MVKIKAFFVYIFGKIHWVKPLWLHAFTQFLLAQPKKVWRATAGIALLLLMLLTGIVWYLSLPQPERIVAKITPPAITPNTQALIPDILSIDFGFWSHGELNTQAVAPLDKIGKEVTAGIRLSPAMPGKWSWESDSYLVFKPANDWPAGQTYTLTFSPSFFSKGTYLEKWRHQFQTQPFQATISNFTLYQDPTHPDIKEAVATLEFNYPVDPSSLEKKIKLQWEALQHKYGNNNQPFKFTLRYDEHKRIAYLHSQPLVLPQQDRYLNLLLMKGIKPIAGPAFTTQEVKASLLIPNADSYFKVTQVATAIVRNPQDKPQQVLTIETTLGVMEKELNKALHVYLLPKDYPATAVETAKPNYHWQNVGEVTPAILALSQPLEWQAIPTERSFSTLHSYQYHALTPAYLYVKIDKGTKGLGGFALAQETNAILSVPAFPQEIAFLHKGALLALGTEEKLSVLIRGLAAVKFDFARVLPDNINHLITQTNGDFSHPYFINPSFNQENISQIFSQIQTFDTRNLAREQYTALDLGSGEWKNKNNRELGLFLLRARGWDAAKKIPLNVQTSRLVLITDLGLIVKDNEDGTHEVFVQSITRGTPVKGASVSILGKNGLALSTRVTDEKGQVSFSPLKDFVDDKEPTVYVVHNGSDVSFIPYYRADRQLNYSRFDIGGVTNTNENQAALTAYLFSDRGIYRPGDTVHIGMIVKQPYVMPQAAGLPLQVTVTDARGVTIKEEKMTLNENGYLTLDFKTHTNSPTGQYLINLCIVKDNHPSNLIGSTTIQIAEFLPDRMRITSHLSAEQPQGWISPDDLKIHIGLWNLYGAPAADRLVQAKLLITPQAVAFKTFPDYIFTDPLLDPKSAPKVFSDTLADARTNAQGQAEFDLKLQRFQKATYQLTVFTQGFEADGGRSVATQTQALVSPLAFLVGYKPDGDLNYIKQNSERQVHLIAINPQLKPLALNKLQLRLFHLHPITTLVKKADGTYQYQSTIQTTEISHQALAIKESGLSYPLATQDIGEFLVRIEDADGLTLSQFKYQVVGNNQLVLPKNAELQVQLNKTAFSAGEDIEMQVTAPYTGAGLITIERDKVYAAQWFKTNTTASLQKIRLPNDFQGDGYVNIAFVRDINSPEIFMSPLSYHVLPFTVTHAKHDLQINLSTAELARPGEPLLIHYQTNKPAKIIIFAVDEGILQVAKYARPDPLQFFFQKHALGVTTLQIVDQILPQFVAERERSAAGGDTGESAIAKNLNPFKRKTDAPVVYWSGILDADTTDKTVTYKLPDYFNGSLRTMAVAVATDAVGSNSKTTEVRGYFVINPNVPTFVAPGDELDITASIANNVAGSGQAKVTIDMAATSQIEIIDSSSQQIIIPEGQERPVHFRVKAKGLLGASTLQWTATLNDKSSTVTSTLSIRPAIPYTTTLTSGYSSAATQSLNLGRDLYPEHRKVQAAVSLSPLILVTGLQQYLNEYPYGCTEQLVSKAFPLLAMSNEAWFSRDQKTITDKINKTIEMLSRRQIASGGFSYWPETGSIDSNAFASVYAMHFLTEARSQGYTVSSDLFAAGIAYLKDLVAQDVTDLNQARIHAYAIYLLTRNEIITTNYLAHLQLSLTQNHQNWQEDITSAYIAATYQLLKNTPEAERLIHYFKPLKTDTSASTDFYDQHLADAQYLYLIAQHFPEHLQHFNVDLLMSLVNALNTDSISTTLSAYTTMALAAYGQFYPIPHNAPITMSEMLANHVKNALPSIVGMYQQAPVNVNSKKIIFDNPSQQRYFYQLLQAGFDKNLPKKATMNGIEVYREYRNLEGKVITHALLGDEIAVHIRARTIDNQYHSNIALVDLLPGGFEVVRDSINLQNMDYVDVREDRVLFFGGLDSQSKEMVYRIKATNMGTYTVPPEYAISMYHPLIRSLGTASRFTIENR